MDSNVIFLTSSSLESRPASSSGSRPSLRTASSDAVVICVLNIHGLPDRHLIRSVNPFVELSSASEVQRSGVLVRGGVNPTFNQEFQLQAKGPIVAVKVYDRTRKGDKLLAEGVIPIDCQEFNASVDLPHTSGNRTATIRFSCYRRHARNSVSFPKSSPLSYVDHIRKMTYSPMPDAKLTTYSLLRSQRSWAEKGGMTETFKITPFAPTLDCR